MFWVGVLVPAGKYSTGSLRISGKGVAFTGVAAWGFQSDGGSVLILNRLSIAAN